MTCSFNLNIFHFGKLFPLKIKANYFFLKKNLTSQIFQSRKKNHHQPNFLYPDCPESPKNGLSNPIGYAIGDTNRCRLPPPQQPVSPPHKSPPVTSSRRHFLPQLSELLLHGELRLEAQSFHHQ